MNEIIINGQNGEWLHKAQKPAEARIPFSLVEFNYFQNYSFCRCYIEQEHGFNHESDGAFVHHFTPMTNFVKPVPNYPPGFVFSVSPEE